MSRHYDELADEMQEEINALEDRVSEVEVELSAEKDRNYDLQKKVESLEEQVDDLEKEKKTLLREIDDHTKTWSDYDEHMNEYRGQIVELNKRIKELELEVFYGSQE